jgi:CHASE3 domain sensor protein
MSCHSSRFARALLTAVFTAAFTVPPAFSATAPQHLVTPGQLQQSAEGASQARERNIEELRQFLSTPQAQKAFQQARVDPKEVKNAVSGLSDQELARLSARARKAQRDFAAGRISNQELIIILLGVILLIVIIIVA